LGLGTWDEGMLDNDSSLDGLGDVAHGVLEDLRRLGEEPPTPESTAPTIDDERKGAA
jgi:hypothetical protein